MYMYMYCTWTLSYGDNAQQGNFEPVTGILGRYSTNTATEAAQLAGQIIKLMWGRLSPAKQGYKLSSVDACEALSSWELHMYMYMYMYMYMFITAYMYMYVCMYVSYHYVCMYVCLLEVA